MISSDGSVRGPEYRYGDFMKADRHLKWYQSSFGAYIIYVRTIRGPAQIRICEWNLFYVPWIVSKLVSFESAIR